MSVKTGPLLLGGSIRIINIQTSPMRTTNGSHRRDGDSQRDFDDVDGRQVLNNGGGGSILFMMETFFLVESKTSFATATAALTVAVMVTIRATIPSNNMIRKVRRFLVYRPWPSAGLFGLSRP
jgi:hypothetical protein